MQNENQSTKNVANAMENHKFFTQKTIATNLQKHHTNHTRHETQNKFQNCKKKCQKQFCTPSYLPRVRSIVRFRQVIVLYVASLVPNNLSATLCGKSANNYLCRSGFATLNHFSTTPAYQHLASFACFVISSVSTKDIERRHVIEIS